MKVARTDFVSKPSRCLQRSTAAMKGSLSKTERGNFTGKPLIMALRSREAGESSCKNSEKWSLRVIREALVLGLM